MSYIDYVSDGNNYENYSGEQTLMVMVQIQCSVQIKKRLLVVVLKM